MKWLLIVTLFSVDGNTKISTPYSTEDACNKAGGYYLEFVKRENPDAVATFDCKPKSEFVQ